jgi:hypothetical protein
MNILLLIFTALVLCLFIPVQAVDTSYIYSFDTQPVPNATISLLKQDGSIYNSWTTNELGAYDLDKIKSYLQTRWSSISNGYTFYIQVEKPPHFDRIWKLQRIDATHIQVNDGNVYTTSTVWTYLKNNLRLTESAGLGYADRTGVTASSTDSGVRVDGFGDEAKIFILGDIHYRYTVQHVNDSGNITDVFVVYPQLIGDDWYVVFDADQWSYYTVDGTLIKVGITDMRLVGDTVQITGDGYDRLILQADISQANWWDDKLVGWNQETLSKPANNPWNTLGAWSSKSGSIGLNIISPDSAKLHSASYSSGVSTIDIHGIYSTYSLDTTNNKYSYVLYADNDLGTSQDIIIEAYTPDNINYFIVEMWNGTAGAYQEILNDSTYTAANLIHLNNSSTGLDFAYYESGQRGDTVSAIYGNTSKADQTVSAYYGCINRTLMLFTLPADDGADSATSGASQVKLRLTVYYNPEGIIDNSNYTNHGTQHGGVSRVRDGQIGEAIEFDGVNDYIDCGNDESLNLNSSNFSLYGRFKTSNIGNYQWIVNKGINFNTAIYGVRIINTNKLQVRIYDVNSVGVSFESDNEINDGEWHKFKVEADRNGIVKLYIDDVQQAATRDISGLGNIDTTNIFVIGAHPDIGSQFFDGYIDEIYVENETDILFRSPMELTPSGAATYEFSYDTNQYYGLKNLELNASGGVSTLMLAKAGTQNVTYITNESGNAITGMTVRADENELIDELFITYANTPTNISAIINQTAIDVDTDSDGDDVPDAFEDENITANKNAQGGELKWDYVWEGAYNIVNSTGYIYYTNLDDGSALVGTELQTASITSTANISVNTAGAGETYNFTVNSGMVDWLNVTSGLISGSNYSIYNGTTIESQLSDGSVNFTTDLSVGTYS